MRNLPVHILIQATFGLIVILTLGAVDFVAQRHKNGPDYGILTYASDLAGRVHVTVRPEKQATIAEMFPEAPAGWERRVYQDADLELVTGAPNLKQKRKISASSLLLGSAMGVNTVTEAEFRTYTNGEQTVLMKIVLIPTQELDGLAGDAIESMAAMSVVNRGETRPFADVRGMRFEESADKAYGVARRLIGQLGTQVTVQLVTRDDDSAVVPLLEGLNVAGLNGFLREPLPEVGKGEVTLILPENPLAKGDATTERAAAVIGAAIAADVVPPTEPEKRSATASFFASIFGGKAAAEEQATAEAAPVQPPPKVFSCTNDKGFKRCAAN